MLNLLQLVAQYGTAFVDNIKYSNKPLHQRLWKERMEPYVESFPLVQYFPTMNPFLGRVLEICSFLHHRLRMA